MRLVLSQRQVNTSDFETERVQVTVHWAFIVRKVFYSVPSSPLMTLRHAGAPIKAMGAAASSVISAAPRISMG